MKNIYILYGGISVEHEIALMSAKNVINNLPRDKYKVFAIYIDKKGAWSYLGQIEKEIESTDQLIKKTDANVALSVGEFLSKYYKADEENFFIPCIHGTTGEDGLIQGFLEILDLPYMGSPVLASACCMDKLVTNQIFDKLEIPQADYVGLIQYLYQADPEKYLAEIEEKLGYPVFVKPANAGSSVGVTRADNREILIEAIKTAFKYDKKILVEDAVIGRELEIAVMGNEFPIASLPGEHVTSGHEFFNYESKYFDKKTVIKAPTSVDKDIEDQARALAVRAYQAVGCKGLARVDIFLREDNKLLVNEINTFPGMTGTSLFPMLWKPTAGFEMKDVLEKLIEYGLDEYKTKKEKTRTID